MSTKGTAFEVPAFATTTSSFAPPRSSFTARASSWGPSVRARSAATVTAVPPSAWISATSDSALATALT